MQLQPIQWNNKEEKAAKKVAVLKSLKTEEESKEMNIYMVEDEISSYQAAGETVWNRIRSESPAIRFTPSSGGTVK